MKIYAKIESNILFVDEKDKEEFIKDYENEYSVTLLETLYFEDGNILKFELLRSRALKDYDFILNY